jgi:hypothetical protein
LLEATPASSQNRGHNATHILAPQNTTATGVDLAAVVIVPSQYLWRIQLLTYSLLLLSVSFAIFPFVLTAFYWPILWLVFVLLIVVVVQSAWRNKHKPPMRFSVTQKIWRLQTSAGEIQVKPCDEILLWDGVIILPVREMLTQRKHWIVALSDSMCSEDWRHFRVWLRIGLSKNIH